MEAPPEAKSNPAKAANGKRSCCAPNEGAKVIVLEVFRKNMLRKFRRVPNLERVSRINPRGVGLVFLSGHLNMRPSVRKVLESVFRYFTKGYEWLILVACQTGIQRSETWSHIQETILRVLCRFMEFGPQINSKNNNNHNHNHNAACAKTNQSEQLRHEGIQRRLLDGCHSES